MTRSRACLHDGASIDCSFCGGTCSDSQSCNTQTCYTYAWYQGGWGACSNSGCGGGTQTKTVYCQRSDGTAVADSYCSGTKPSATQSCNTNACTAVRVSGNGYSFAANAPGSVCFDVPAAGRYKVMAYVATCSPQGSGGFGFSNISFGGTPAISQTKTNAPPFDAGACWDIVQLTSSAATVQPGRRCVSGSLVSSPTGSNGACNDGAIRCHYTIQVDYVGP
jgi:hypothetical protein